jgi:ribonuclease G
MDEWSLGEAGEEEVEMSQPTPSSGQDITELLREGQELLVQVSKEPIGGKGARVTAHITLPGRYLVYMPGSRHVGVSRRIEDEEERGRLRSIAARLACGAGGLIVRTAGEGRSEEDLEADCRFLKDVWSDVLKRAEVSRAPVLIHRELTLVDKVIRDLVDDSFSELLLDSETDYARVLEFLSRFMPELTGRVKLYSLRMPIFEHYGIETEIEKALRSKVWLKSGGYIVTNQTEALVAIDVNTGRYVGKNSLEETALKTNLEAVKEIVRQLTLRDLGGIIVVDFIDMEEPENRERVFSELEQALKDDRSKTKILQISDFGLVEITRKRVRQSLERTLCQPCADCGGTGRVKSTETICYGIHRDILKTGRRFEGAHLVLRVHPNVADALGGREHAVVEDLEQTLGVTLEVQADANLHLEHYDIMS